MMKKCMFLWAVISCVALLCACGDIPEGKNNTETKNIENDKSIEEEILPENTRGWDYLTLFDDIYLTADENQKVQLDRLSLRYSAYDIETNRAGINGLKETAMYSAPQAKGYVRKILQAVGKLPAKDRYITLDEVEKAIQAANRNCSNIKYPEIYVDEIAAREKCLVETCETEDVMDSKKGCREIRIRGFLYSAENYDKLADYYENLQNKLKVKIRGIYNFASTIEEAMWLSEFVDAMNQYVGAPDEMSIQNGLCYWMDSRKTEWIQVYSSIDGITVSLCCKGDAQVIDEVLLYSNYHIKSDEEQILARLSKVGFEQARKSVDEHRKYLNSQGFQSIYLKSELLCCEKPSGMTEFEYQELLRIIDEAINSGNFGWFTWMRIRDSIATPEQKELIENWERDWPAQQNVYGCKKRLMQIMGFLPERETYITLQQVLKVYNNIDWNTVNQENMERVFCLGLDQYVGAADWEGGSGIHQSVYYLDGTYTKWIRVTATSVVYQEDDNTRVNSTKIISLSNGIFEENLEKLNEDLK